MRWVDPPHKQDRPIGQGKGDTGQWLGGEEGAQGGEIGELQEETCAARVCDEGEGGDGAQDLRGMCAGLGEINRGRGGFVVDGQQLKSIGVANREGAGVSGGLGGVGESRRRFCWVCLL